MNRRLARQVNIEIKSAYNYYIGQGSIKLSICNDVTRIFLRGIEKERDLYLILKSTKRLRNFLDKAINEIEKRRIELKRRRIIE